MPNHLCHSLGSHADGCRLGANLDSVTVCGVGLIHKVYFQKPHFCHQHGLFSRRAHDLANARGFGTSNRSLS
jgi:hypothetical protein